MSVVLGLDMSLTSTGWALINSGLTPTLTSVDRIQSKGKATASLEERRRRIRAITSSVVRLVDGYAQVLVVIEQPAFSSTTGHAHDRSGLWWHVVDRLAAREGVTVAEVPPSTRAKYATGKGNAGKDQVLAAVVRRYPAVEVTGNDEADALTLAAMGARHLGQPVDDLPQLNLAAMDKVRWPDQETSA